MKIAVLTRARDPMSLAIYRDNVVRELEALGCGCTPVDEHGRPAAVGADRGGAPGRGVRRVPDLLRRTELPVVVTVHGLLAFALPGREAARTLADRGRQALMSYRVRRDWRGLRDSVRKVIAVSSYGAGEAQRSLSLPDAVVEPILHGVDHGVFHPLGPRAARARPYFLMVAQYQPKKNVARVLDAFRSLPTDGRPDLVAIVPGFPAREAPPDGVTVLRTPHAPAELARFYRGALALVAPSLHETFGMPLAEAMACGCPVITANTTACPEVTGGAALCVDPRSVDAIRDAMIEVQADTRLRSRMAERGLARAATLTWAASGRRHAEVFEAAIAGGVV